MARKIALPRVETFGGRPVDPVQWVVVRDQDVVGGGWDAWELEGTRRTGNWITAANLEAVRTELRQLGLRWREPMIGDDPEIEVWMRHG